MAGLLEGKVKGDLYEQIGPVNPFPHRGSDLHYIMNAQCTFFHSYYFPGCLSQVFLNRKVNGNVSCIERLRFQDHRSARPKLLAL